MCQSAMHQHPMLHAPVHCSSSEKQRTLSCSAPTWCRRVALLTCCTTQQLYGYDRHYILQPIAAAK